MKRAAVYRSKQWRKTLEHADTEPVNSPCCIAEHGSAASTPHCLNVGPRRQDTASLFNSSSCHASSGHRASDTCLQWTRHAMHPCHTAWALPAALLIIPILGEARRQITESVSLSDQCPDPCTIRMLPQSLQQRLLQGCKDAPVAASGRCCSGYLCCIAACCCSLAVAKACRCRKPLMAACTCSAA